MQNYPKTKTSHCLSACLNLTAFYYILRYKAVYNLEKMSNNILSSLFNHHDHKIKTLLL
ncbi:hypothetical protein MGSAQ_003179 [marine sediment metagenome]|uniref:Uncharacterized protein n=1 Tax=marine sediment metagenome TaxID=412755 RepID=A0A1B6NPS2_9ZZZZ